MALSRWLVGSSSISSSARLMSTPARATRLRWPPERVSTLASWSLIPSSLSMLLAVACISSLEL